MNIAIVMAAGNGSRMKLDFPKQFLELDKKPLFLHSLITFSKHPEIDRVILVCDSEHIELAKSQIFEFGIDTEVTIGGATRQESVYLGLCCAKKAVGSGDDDVVLIHDCARPFVSAQIISDCIKAAYETGACTAAIPSQDTILISENGEFISNIPKRSLMYCVQTPQAFKLCDIISAHEQAVADGITATDDAGIFISQGKPVKIVQGDKRNFKITTKEDLALAKSLSE